MGKDNAEGQVATPGAREEKDPHLRGPACLAHPRHPLLGHGCAGGAARAHGARSPCRTPSRRMVVRPSASYGGAPDARASRRSCHTRSRHVASRGRAAGAGLAQGHQGGCRGGAAGAPYAGRPCHTQGRNAASRRSGSVGGAAGAQASRRPCRTLGRMWCLGRPGRRAGSGQAEPTGPAGGCPAPACRGVWPGCPPLPDPQPPGWDLLPDKSAVKAEAPSRVGRAALGQAENTKLQGKLRWASHSFL